MFAPGTMNANDQSVFAVGAHPARPSTARPLSAGVVTVVVLEIARNLAVGVRDAHAPAEGRLGGPHQSALNVEILEREAVLLTEQRGQLTGADRHVPIRNVGQIVGRHISVERHVRALLRCRIDRLTDDRKRIRTDGDAALQLTGVLRERQKRIAEVGLGWIHVIRVLRVERECAVKRIGRRGRRTSCRCWTGADAGGW